ncbi:MAG: hypothetical protein ACK5Q5_01060 [Planctomycetaceae bacterium]
MLDLLQQSVSLVGCRGIDRATHQVDIFTSLQLEVLAFFQADPAAESQRDLVYEPADCGVRIPVSGHDEC